MTRSSTRILNAGKSRESQFDFFLLDHEKWFSLSQSCLETWKSQYSISFSLKKWHWSYENLDLVSSGESKKNNSWSRFGEWQLPSYFSCDLKSNPIQFNCRSGQQAIKNQMISILKKVSEICMMSLTVLLFYCESESDRCWLWVDNMSFG